MSKSTKAVQIETPLHTRKEVSQKAKVNENTVHKVEKILELGDDLTLSEKVAIGKAVEEAIGNRQGQRTDLEDGELVSDLTQVESGQKTRDVAAESAGFSSTTQYHNTKKVTEE